jgi:hypothetical protein
MFSTPRQLVRQVRTALPRSRPTQASRARPHLEHLEGRDAPAVWTVTNLLDNVAGSLRAEVALAQDGDTVRFAHGLRGQVTLTGGPIDVNRSIDIAGPGLDKIVVSGNHNGRVFNVPADQTVSISELSIVNGSAADQGGAIDNLGTLTVSGCALTGNSAAGALGGGAISNAGALTVRASTLANNSAPAGGGISNHAGTLTVSGSTLAGNFATLSDGGGIFLFAGTVTVSGSTLAGNWCSDTHGGGGIYDAAAGMLTVSDSAFSSNAVTGLSGTRGGGAILNNGALVLSGSTLANNTAYRGGAILNGLGATLTIADSTLAGNSAAALAGGIYANGTLTITDSSISGNASTQSTGGIYLQQCTAAIRGSTVADNAAATNGGGLFITDGTSVTVRDSTLSGNTAGWYGGGVAYGATQAGDVSTFTSVTVTANRDNTNGSSFTGAGISVPSTSVSKPELHNTLVAGNFNGATGLSRDDVAGQVGAGSDYNLVGDGNGLSGLTDGVNGNQVGTHANPINPLLGTLGNYGGPTHTVPLLAASPALNAGDPAQLGTADQRGLVRSGGVNIGAFQASAAALLIGAPNGVVAGAPFGVTVTAVDALGQTAVGYTGTVHFSSADPYGAGLPADYPFQPGVAGQAAFPAGATLYTAGTWDVTATDAGSGITGSANVTVTAAAPDHLVFLQPPSDTPAGQTIRPVVVAVVDQYGNVVTGDNSDVVTLSLDPNAAGGTLTSASGLLTITVANGQATFSDLSIDLPGMGYALHASIGGALPDIDSDPFNVT